MFMVKRYKENEIDNLVKILRNDGVISVPTDTVFGICGRLTKKVKEKLIKIKERPLSKSFPIMCYDINQIKSIAVVGEKEERIINEFMPGPITIILKKKKEIEDFITNGKETIAIRMAPNKTIREITKKVGPIFMTSANKSGEKECKTLDEIEKSCKMLDGMVEGKVIFSESSTIVDLTKDNIEILREGPITLGDIIKNK